MSVRHFALRLIRLGFDIPAGLFSNLAASAIDRGDARVASICLAAATAFTAIKATADHYLTAQDQREGEEGMTELVERYGGLRQAIEAIAARREKGSLFAAAKAQELLGLLPATADDEAL